MTRLSKYNVKGEYVYIIGCRYWVMTDGTKYYKIGFTNDLNQRMVQLKKKFNRKDISYIKKYNFHNSEYSHSKVESVLKKKLKKYNVKNDCSTELFNVTLENIENIINEYCEL